MKSIKEDLEILKTAIIAIFGSVNFVDLVNIIFQKVQKLIEINFQINVHKYVLQWQVMRLSICQLWFHVKSEWQKNSAISTLWLDNENYFYSLIFPVKSILNT